MPVGTCRHSSSSPGPAHLLLKASVFIEMHFFFFRGQTFAPTLAGIFSRDSPELLRIRALGAAESRLQRGALLGDFTAGDTAQ